MTHSESTSTTTERGPQITPMARARLQSRVEVSGVIRSVQAVPAGGTVACRCTIADETGELDLLFLGRTAVAGLEPGRRCRAAGRATERRGRTVLWNPRYWLGPPVLTADLVCPAGLPAGPGGHRPAAAARPLPPACHVQTGRAAARRVLIADDDRAIRQVLQLSLSARGYQVNLAATGSEAIALARRGPGLVILDIGLPDISGLDAIGAIRSTCGAPVIVISGQEERAARAAAMVAGASDFLAKPFPLGRLLTKIRDLTGSHLAAASAKVPGGR
jgi:CheY-like chemotaxis protein